MIPAQRNVKLTVLGKQAVELRKQTGMSLYKGKRSQHGLFFERIPNVCRRCKEKYIYFISRLTPNDPYMGLNAPLTSKRCILHIYSTNICTEYFKHALYSPFFSLQNAFCFIMLTSLVPVLLTFYIQGVLKLKK